MSTMPVRDYSNGQNESWANLVRNVNANEEARRNSQQQHLETMGKVGLAFALGTILQRLFQRRR